MNEAWPVHMSDFRTILFDTVAANELPATHTSHHNNSPQPYFPLFKSAGAIAYVAQVHQPSLWERESTADHQFSSQTAFFLY